MEVEDILVAVRAICAGRVRAARSVRREAVEIDGIKDRSSAGMCGELVRETEGLAKRGWFGELSSDKERRDRSPDEYLTNTVISSGLGKGRGEKFDNKEEVAIDEEQVDKRSGGGGGDRSI